MMKDGVVILNFARDLLVNDDDMAEALKTGKVKKYVTDFPNAKTANMEGCLAIPHLGASTEESEDNCAAMAVQELKNYIENGNIVNSVNFPNCDAGLCETDARMTILHRNVPNMLSQFTTVLGTLDLNIEHMTNKSKGAYAYSVFDYTKTGSISSKEIKEKMEAIDNVLKVRIIK